MLYNDRRRKTCGFACSQAKYGTCFREHIFTIYIPKQMHIHILLKDKCFCSKTTLQIDREWIKKDDVYIQNPAYERKV